MDRKGFLKILKSFLKITRKKALIFLFLGGVFLFLALQHPVWMNTVHAQLMYFLFLPGATFATLLYVLPSYLFPKEYVLSTLLFLFGGVVYFHIYSCVVVFIEEKTVKKIKVPFSYIFVAIIVAILVLGPTLNPKYALPSPDSWSQFADAGREFESSAEVMDFLENDLDESFYVGERLDDGYHFGDRRLRHIDERLREGTINEDNLKLLTLSQVRDQWKETRHGNILLNDKEITTKIYYTKGEPWFITEDGKLYAYYMTLS